MCMSTYTPMYIRVILLKKIGIKRKILKYSEKKTHVHQRNRDKIYHIFIIPNYVNQKTTE